LADNAPWKPDLWLEVNGGLQPVDRPKEMYAVVGTDPHVLNGLYDRIRPRADKFFNMQTPYMKRGDIWLPYAHDPVWHAPTPIKWEDRSFDCSLIGLHYPDRVSFFKQLKAAGYSTHFSIGRAYFDAADIYHDTRVGFNKSSLLDTTARVFELMGFSIVPLLNRVPDLMSMFEDGKHFLGFNTLGEAIEKFKWALDNPLEAQVIADAGHQAVQHHTWDARVQTILEECGLV
jgi:spore maturation protein CgeB